ncbi:hypothetical protein CW693_03050 [Candidatus Bathyarchaeota archaeon]|nr:MAG: hypothetical protein CW693_03050 [Candidatus Bathyarchaeota archaeon]RLI15373.1 MAG: hypothetical protein DRO41_04335 [Candidatus Bathyarchaeota archaeon]HDN05553.1 hypothetical protein [Candidatus Bathyarchaeota archaeon]
MTESISKKEAAAVSAAIAAYLAKPRLTEEVLSPASDVQGILEALLDKVSQLERRMEELTASVNELKEKVEQTGR